MIKYKWKPKTIFQFPKNDDVPGIRGDKIMTAIIIVLIAAAAFIVLCSCLASYAVHGERYTLEETFKDQCEQMPEVEKLKEVKTTEYEVTNPQGYVLHAQFYPADPEYAKGESGVNGAIGRKFIILVHGYTLNRNGELKYMPMYRRLGYNCIVYDHRGHGLNAKAPCSFGIKEGRDLIAIIDDTYKRYGQDIFLGLTGESLGGGTEITALRYRPNVKFVVNDCGFATIIPVEKDGLKRMHLPTWLVYPADICARVLFDVPFAKARPIDSLKDNKVPICFIHGDEDTFINCCHSVEMSKATAGYKELHLVKGAIHARALNTDPKGYEEIVDKFVTGVENGTIK